MRRNWAASTRPPAVPQPAKTLTPPCTQVLNTYVSTNDLVPLYWMQKECLGNPNTQMLLVEDAPRSHPGLLPCTVQTPSWLSRASQPANPGCQALPGQCFPVSRVRTNTGAPGAVQLSRGLHKSTPWDPFSPFSPAFPPTEDEYGPDKDLQANKKQHILHIGHWRFPAPTLSVLAGDPSGNATSQCRQARLPSARGAMLLQHRGQSPKSSRQLAPPVGSKRYSPRCALFRAHSPLNGESFLLPSDPGYLTSLLLPTLVPRMYRRADFGALPVLATLTDKMRHAH